MGVVPFQSAAATVSQGSSPSLFESEELQAILEIYGDKVRQNEWRDYTIFLRDSFTSFVVLDTNQDTQKQIEIRSFTVEKNEDGSLSYKIDDQGYIICKNCFEDALAIFDNGIGQKEPALTLVAP